MLQGSICLTLLIAKKKDLDICVFITLICSSHFNFSSIYIPRNFVYFVLSINMSESCKSILVTTCRF